MKRTTTISDLHICGNERCKRGADGARGQTRNGGAYCSKTCGSAVRMQKVYARRKAGVKLERCPACEGTGFVESKEKPKSKPTGHRPKCPTSAEIEAARTEIDKTRGRKP